MPDDTNYFSIDRAMSWKDVAQKMKAGEELPDFTAEAEDEEPHPWQIPTEHGQLALDIYQTASDLIVEAPIAGVRPEDLDISIKDDLLTIKGQRRRCNEVAEDDMIYQECHWGDFSRSIVLPVDVVPDRIDATLKNGILNIRLPKAQANKKIRVKVE